MAHWQSISPACRIAMAPDCPVNDHHVEQDVLRLTAPADAIDALLSEERELIATARFSRADIIAQGSALSLYPFDEFVGRRNDPMTALWSALHLPS
jgi:hypothetical protein